MEEILFKVTLCQPFLFRQSKILLVVHLGLCESCLVFQRREYQINAVCKRLYVDDSYVGVQKYKFISLK